MEISQRVTHSYFDPEELLEVIRDSHLEYRLVGRERFEIGVERGAFPSGKGGDGALSRGEYEMPVLVKGAFGEGGVCLIDNRVPRTGYPDKRPPAIVVGEGMATVRG